MNANKTCACGYQGPRKEFTLRGGKMSEKCPKCRRHKPNKTYKQPKCHAAVSNFLSGGR